MRGVHSHPARPDSPAPTAPPLYSKNRLRFRARLPDRWVDATATTIHQRLGDLLNQEGGNLGLILVDEVQIEGVESAADADSPAYASLNLGQIRIVIPVEEGPGAHQNTFEWLRKRPNLVRVGIANFEIVGDLYLAEAQTLRDVITRPTPPFMVLTAARLQQCDGARRVEEHRTIFVNRKLAEFILPEG